MALITRRTQFKTESNPPPDIAKILKALADESAAGTRPIKQQGVIRSIVQRSSKFYDGKGKADDALRYLENECVVFYGEGDRGCFYFDPERVGEILACCVAGRRTSDLSLEEKAARLAELIERCANRKSAESGSSGSKDASTSSADESELEADEPEAQSPPSNDSSQSDVATTSNTEEARMIHPNRLAISGVQLVPGRQQASLTIQLSESPSSIPDAFLDPRAIRRLSDEELRQRFAACTALGRYAESCSENIDFEQQLRDETRQRAAAEAGTEQGSAQEPRPRTEPRDTFSPQAASPS